MIPRLVQDLVTANLQSSGKIVLVLGARQVGKTTMVKDIATRLERKGKKTLYLNCDIAEDMLAINTNSQSLLERVVATIDVLLIDEAQRLDNPGLTLKIIHDLFPHIRVLATGSSSFDLKNKLSDALTGRYVDFTLHPLSLLEILNQQQSDALLKAKADMVLPQTLLYGSYPEIVAMKTSEQKQTMLERLVESYLFKDVLSFQMIKYPQAIRDLTKALAYQIGSEVNEYELANRLGIDRKTVVSYLDILEKTYVIIRSRPYSQNPRREIGRHSKVYFVDLGVRNALIGDFNSLELRTDIGAIWKNFLFIERQKYYANQGTRVQHNFWRSYSGAEVDYLEKELNNNIQAFEFKYGSGTFRKGAKSFTQRYGIEVQLVSRENYFDFIQRS